MINIIIHIVKQGESLHSISKLYSVPIDNLIVDNDIKDPNMILSNQSIVIDKIDTDHLYKNGESIEKIAELYNIALDELLSINPGISNPNDIIPGTRICVQRNKYKDIEVNGYIYPNINMQVLKQTLPHLTYLSIFSYAVNTDGSLDNIDDLYLIKLAKEQQVAPLMVITNKYFSSYIARGVLNNSEIQNTLLDNILHTLKTKEYYGLNIDFEYIFPGDRKAYNSFLQRTSEILEPLGYPVFTALAPKISSEQTGMLYEAHDYKIHGELGDCTILMTYEWGYTYSTPMAVAPARRVKQVLDYAIKEIPANKILMGIPNYGYDWRLPWVQGTAASALSNNNAIQRAIDYSAELRYDPHAHSPYFYYYDEMDKLHVVWFEDARSIKAKLSLVNQYNLAGISYWTVNRFFPQNWIVLKSMFNIVKIL